MTVESHKLYAITTESCTLPLHATPNGAIRYPADNVPQLFWPDDTVCWAANMFLLHGYRRGKSRKNRGGTLLTWSKNLSHLIRWCYDNRIDFIDLTDSHFRMFVNNLLSEKDSVHIGESKRGEQQVANICSTALRFIAFLNERMPGLDLIGPTSKIRAEKKTFQIKSPTSGKTINRTAWVHECVPRNRKTRRRQPISSEAVNRLYEENARAEVSAFVSRRRFSMLRLLEITGGRRIEVSLVEVRDLEDAIKTGELKVFTAKQQRDAYRYVPVTQSDLKELLSFVKHYRQRVIRGTIGTAHDHGRLFVAEKTGLPLEIDTLGSELYSLRKAAGIDDEEACMHAFRHRYATNIFRNLIKSHHYQNPDDLKRALLSTETLKAKVMQWTGHSHIDSLDHYIHLAFEAESNFAETLDLLKAQQVVGSLQIILKDYKNRLKQQKSPGAILDELSGLIDIAALELNDAMRGSILPSAAENNQQ